MPLTVTNAHLDGTSVSLRCVDGRIDRIGDISADPADEILDARGMAIVPGLVNAHTHAGMTLFRSRGDDLPLMQWLQEAIWPAERRLTADDVLWGTRLAAIEMIRSGTTHFWDMYWRPPSVAQAVTDLGIRATVSAVVFDGGPEASAEDRAKVRDDVQQELAALEAFGDRVTVGLGPHAVYTVSEDTLAWAAALADEHDLPIQIHVSETEGEVSDCVAVSGVRPPELLRRTGVLGPRTVAAHCCWVDEDELELFAETGVTVAANPVSNMKLATGRHFWMSTAMRHGVAVGLGTDGPGSNNGLNMLNDAKIMTLLAKHEKVDAAAMGARTTFGIAAGQHSPLLGGTPIQVGAKADFLLVDTNTPELAGGGDLYGNLVYANAAGSITTVVIDGHVVMRERAIPNEDEIIAEASARAHHLLDA